MKKEGRRFLCCLRERDLCATFWSQTQGFEMLEPQRTGASLMPEKSYMDLGRGWEISPTQGVLNRSKGWLNALMGFQDKAGFATPQKRSELEGDRTSPIQRWPCQRVPIMIECRVKTIKGCIWGRADKLVSKTALSSEEKGTTDGAACYPSISWGTPLNRDVLARAKGAAEDRPSRLLEEPGKVPVDKSHLDHH